jgi:mannosyltransferase OCH1-like enzyme
MKIPRLIHQTWKTNDIPNKWYSYTQKVKLLNPDWEYKLWTDEDNENFVKSEFPDFYPIFMGLSKNIMRADVIRYLIMYKIGGVYLDIDYEMLKPFDFEDYSVVLPMNRSLKHGDSMDGLGNCIFASVPGHKFWSDVIQDLQKNPPIVNDYMQVFGSTGPAFLTRIFNENSYDDIYIPERLIYHPPIPRNKMEIELVKSNNISIGIHHSWGSWREHWTWAYLKYKINKWIK